MRLWTGKTRAQAMIAFREPTIFTKTGKPPWINYRAHPIRSLFGLGIGRTIICVMRCDAPKDERVERTTKAPEHRADSGAVGEA